MIVSREEHLRYQELAAAVVEIACSDYIDALIVKERGYLIKSDYMRTLYRKAIRYGEKRFIWKGKDGYTHRRPEEQNIKTLKLFKKTLEGTEEIMNAEATIYVCEQFFRSQRFTMYMPNTSSEWLIQMCRERAKRGERMRTKWDR